MVPLKAGQAYDYTLNLYAGYADAAAFKGQTRVEKGVTWQVVRQKPNEKGEYELVTEADSAQPKIMLREGKYLLIARFGEMWGKGDLSVTAGEVAKIKIKLVKDTNLPVIASN